MTRHERLLYTGTRIRALRTHHGMTQKAVGALLDISSVAYGRFERGIEEVSDERLHFLAGLFRVSVAELLPGNP